MTTAPAIPPANLCLKCGSGLGGDGLCRVCVMAGILDGFEESHEAAAPPQNVGDYELLEELARGGMGVVWRARQRRLNREVALKFVLNGVLPGETVARRFRQEAEVAARLSHPNIIAVHEVGEADGRYFISMELAVGGTLAERLKRERLAPREAAALLIKLARAMQHAHDHGVLHRDLKPANVLFDAAGEPRISDFGLSRLATEESALTMAGSVLGTPSYMAPEQARGESTTTAADIYALGILLYEMLAGQPVFAGEVPVEVLRRVIDEEPPALAGADRDLETICLKCLRKSPAARYASAAALADDLERWQRGEPVLARRISTAERFIKWTRRRPLLAALWLALALASAVGAGIFLTARVRLAEARGAAEASARESLHRKAEQHTAAAVLAIERGDSLRALPLLAEAIRLGTGDPQHDRVNRIRFSTCQSLSPDLEQVWHPKWVEDVQMAESIGCIALSEGDHVRLLRFSDGQDAVPPMMIPASARHVAFHPELKTLLVQTLKAHEVRLFDATTGKPIQQLPGQFLLARHLFANGSTKLAIWNNDTARCFDLAAPEAAAPTITHPGALAWAYLSADAQRILTCGEDNHLRVWDSATARLIGQPIVCPPKTKLLVEDSTARHALVQAYEQIGQTVDLTAGTIDPHSKIAGDIRAAHHGLLGTVFARSIREGFAISYATTGVPLVTATHGPQGNDARFSANGELLFTRALDGSGRLWNTRARRAASPFLWQASDPFHAALSQSADRIVVTDRNGEVRLWKARALNGAMRKFSLSPTEKLKEQLRDHTATEERGRNNPLNLQAENSPLLFQTSGESPHVLHARHTLGGPDILPPMQHQSRVITAQLSPDGRRIATFTMNQSVILWDAATGQQVSPPLHHDREIQMIAFSPDSALLLSIGAHTLHVWESATGSRAAPPMLHAQPLWRAWWSADGGTIHTVDNKGFQTEWSFAPETRPHQELAPVAHRLSAHYLRQHGALAPGE